LLPTPLATGAVWAHKDGLGRWFWGLPDVQDGSTNHWDASPISNRPDRTGMLRDASVQNGASTHYVSSSSSSLNDTSNHPEASHRTDIKRGGTAWSVGRAVEDPPRWHKPCPAGLLCSLSKPTGSPECCGYPDSEADS